jgi:hypothetical protein
MVAGTDKVLVDEEVVVTTELVVTVGPLVNKGVSNCCSRPMHRQKGDTAKFLFKEGGTERWE